jgi:bacterioferritin-associated ferredoxin
MLKQIPVSVYRSKQQVAFGAHYWAGTGRTAGLKACCASCGCFACEVQTDRVIAGFEERDGVDGDL